MTWEIPGKVMLFSRGSMGSSYLGIFIFWPGLGQPWVLAGYHITAFVEERLTGVRHALRLCVLCGG
ncbi:hypothetical protein CPC08DRAFT_706954 [Agrocybe pediades]|nr:hypothetical protein CPC08DRAFT_706954 [Agrocybe pediades]